MSEREQRVREIAHRLWEEEGRPADQEKRHWATAERMVDAQQSASTADSEAPTASAAATGKRRAARTPAKRTPAAAQNIATRPH